MNAEYGLILDIIITKLIKYLILGTYLPLSKYKDI